MTWLADAMHRLAHRLDTSAAPCACTVSAYQRGWKARRDAELREIENPASPDELDAAFRRLIAESEA